MVSKTFIFKKPAVKIKTSTGTTYTTRPTTVSGGSGPRQQIFIGGEKLVERTGESGVVRVAVKTKSGTKWVVQSKAEEQIQDLQSRGLTRQQAEDKVLAGQVLREPGVKLREKEFLVRQVVEPGQQQKGLLPRKVLEGRVDITEPKTIEEQMLTPEKIKSKSRFELFSPAAQEKLRLSESKEGLLEIGTGVGRKIVISPKGGIEAEIPETAQFYSGFGSQLGTAKPSLIGLKTAGGVLPFTTIGEIFKDTEKKVAEKTTYKIFPDYEKVKERTIAGEEKGLRAWELKNLPKWFVGGKITEESFDTGFQAGTRRGLYETIREKPVTLAAYAATTFGLSKGFKLLNVGKYGMSKNIIGGGLGAIYAGTKGYQIGAAKTSYEKGLVVGSTIPEIGAMIVGSKLAGAGTKPTKAKVVKAKGLTGDYAEALKSEGKTSKSLIRFEIPTEIKTRVLRTRVKAYTRKVTPPKDINKLGQFSLRKDIRTVYGLKENILKKISEPVFYQNVKSKIRIYNVKPDAFEIKIDGKISTKVGTSPFTISKDVKGISRIIDPKIYKQIPSGKGFTILEKATTETLPKRIDLTASLTGEGTITGKVIKKIKGVSNIFGVGLSVPATFETTTTTRLISKPLFSVTPLIEPAPLLFSPVNIFDVLGERRRKPIVGLGSRLERGTISRVQQARIQRQKPISDVSKIINSIQGLTPIQEPVIDVRKMQDRTPISDVFSIVGQKSKQDYKEQPIDIPEFPIKEVPTTGGFWFPKLDLFLGAGIKRKRKSLKKQEAYTPDFIASVLNQFGAAPTQRLFSGQERRLKVRGRRTISPLPKKNAQEGLIRIITRQLGG